MLIGIISRPMFPPFPKAERFILKFVVPGSRA